MCVATPKFRWLYAGRKQAKHTAGFVGPGNQVRELSKRKERRICTNKWVVKAGWGTWREGGLPNEL
jgi:hypothetical protein